MLKFNYWDLNFDVSDEANYFNASDYKWSLYIEQNSETIIDEINKFLAKNLNELKPYFIKELDNESKGWKTISFKTWGIPVKNNLAKSETISDLLSQFPEIVSASLNYLGPHSKINGHHGDTNGIFRCHFGVKIPSSFPEIGFSVSGEEKAWEKGKILIFNDAKYHHAWNNTDEDRIIFLFDVIRPEFIIHKKKICLKVRSFLLLQYLLAKMPILKNFSRKLHVLIMEVLRFVLAIIHPLQLKFGVFISH